MAEIRKLKNYINGEWVESKTDQYEDVVNPATKEVLCQVPISTKEDIDYAAQTAAEAFKTWSKVAVPRRARILFNFQQLLSQHKEELAHLITIENGKNTKEASLLTFLIFSLKRSPLKCSCSFRRSPSGNVVSSVYFPANKPDTRGK